MSFFDIFKKKNGGSAARGSRYYIVDAATLDSNKGERVRLNPRSQMDVLRRLSRFVKKEKLEICAVFEGKPLRDAPDNKVYNEVLVRYADDAGQVPDLVGRIDAGSRGKDVLVITADKLVETSVMKRHGALMHSSTFRKALESNGGSGGRSDRSSGGGRRRQGRKSGPPRSRSQNQGDDSQPRSSNEKKKSPKQDNDPVSELIDLV
jgi:hypothetical protein